MTMSDSNLAPRRVSETELSLRQLTLPEHSNPLGNVHGGTILKLCDECGGIVATRHARRPAVTVTFDRVNFYQPVYVGQLLSVHGRITHVGHTSMEVELHVEAENMLTGEIIHTNSAYCVYVALDEEGRPTPVPPLLLETDEERRRFEEGRQRQERRLAMRKPTP
jgi:uncharacterized protein (TIGR00369 family)